MPGVAGGFRTAGAGSTTLPIAGLTAAAARRLRIREIGIFNTTSTAVSIAIRRITAIGTPGAGQTEVYVDDESMAVSGTLLDTWTVTPTFVTGNVRVYSLGAAVGSGIVQPFGDNGLVVPQGTGNGVVIVPLTGTGQICDVYFDWDE